MLVPLMSNQRSKISTKRERGKLGINGGEHAFDHCGSTVRAVRVTAKKSDVAIKSARESSVRSIECER